MQTVDTLSGLAPAVIALLLSGVITVLMSVIKPLIEVWVPPTNKAHDSVIQGSTLAMGIGVEFWLYQALNLPWQGGLLPFINGILVGAASMGNYSAVAKRLGFTGLTTGGATSPTPPPSPTGDIGGTSSGSTTLSPAAASATPAQADVVAGTTAAPTAKASSVSRSKAQPVTVTNTPQSTDPTAAPAAPTQNG